MVLLLTSLYRGNLNNQWPYGEYEDIQSVCQPIEPRPGAQDQVWVNHDAVPAVQFYQRTKDSRFCYGKFYPRRPSAVHPGSACVRCSADAAHLADLFHLQQPSDRAEEQLIVHFLRPGWDVHCVAAPRNAEIYMANRRAPSVR